MILTDNTVKGEPMSQTYRRYISTVTVTQTGISAFKKIAPKANVDETARERHERLAEQGSTNHARVKNLGNGKFSVKSQQKTSEGHALQGYVVLWTGNGWLCECQFGTHQPGVECAHVARVLEYVARHKLPFGGSEVVKSARAASEAVTDEWISRARAERKARGRQELQEEL